MKYSLLRKYQQVLISGLWPPMGLLTGSRLRPAELGRVGFRIRAGASEMLPLYYHSDYKNDDCRPPAVHGLADGLPAPIRRAGEGWFSQFAPVALNCSSLREICKQLMISCLRPPMGLLKASGLLPGGPASVGFPDQGRWFRNASPPLQSDSKTNDFRPPAVHWLADGLPAPIRRAGEGWFPDSGGWF